jgi:hypothetical protein
MKKIRHLCCYLLCLLALSSYANLFEYDLVLYETGHIHDNGSGQLEIAVDLTKAEQLVKIVSLLTDITLDTAKESVKDVFSEISDDLKRISGISNVATTHDDKMLHFKLGFHFNSIKALNRAMHELYTHADYPGRTYFEMDHRAFSRVDTQDIEQLLTYYYEKVDPRIANMIPQKSLNVITYNLAYSFDKKIKHTTNALFSISEDRRTLLLNTPLFDAYQEKLSLSNKVLF